MDCSKAKSSIRVWAAAAMVCGVGFYAAELHAEWVDLGSREPAPVSVMVMKSDELSTILQVNISGFDKQDVVINGQAFTQVLVPGTQSMNEVGSPQLPQLGKHIALPSLTTPELVIRNMETREFSVSDVIPSKGPVLRNQNPEEIAYTFSPFYSSRETFPASVARLGEVFQMRDVAGVNLIINPVQYDRARGVIRVVTSMEVEVLAPHASFKDSREVGPVDVSFADIYQNAFVNYDAMQSSRKSLLRGAHDILDTSKLLIITDKSFADALKPFVAWKKQRGLHVTVATTDQTGKTAVAIKDFIQKAYDNDKISYVLLVGDAEFVAFYPGTAGNVSKNEADPMYALVKGGDNYADIVVSRWSVKTVADVNNIATKSINYEKTPDASGDWYSKGAGVASNQSDGSGPDHPLDKERAELLRGMMMKWHYKAVDQIYDPSASKAALAKALNEGRGFINYIGHGSETLWGTTGFSNSDINALTNKSMLPFIVSVACVNGHFAYTGGDSFAEVWLKTGSDTNPRGAIGIFASSTNQSWVEPTVGQKSVTELLVGEKLNTMGALFFQGAVAVLESGMSAALQTVQSWHTFGDGTLQVRTTKPAAIKMRMPTVLNAKDTTLALNVGEKNLVASVVQEDELIGTAVSAADGSLTITYEKSLTSGKNATITVTGFNKVPQIADIPVGAKKKKKTMFENILDRLF